MSNPNIKVGAIAVSMMFVMELTLVPLLLPSIQAYLDVSYRQLAWVFNSYGLCVAIGVLLGGWFGDRMRTTNVFAAGVIAFIVGSLAVAYSSNYEQMIVGRTVQGFGAGVFSPLIPILLTRASPNQPGRVLIVWGSLTGFVAAFAPLVFSAVSPSQEFQYAFVFLAVVSLIGLVIVLRAPGKEPPSDDAQSKNNIGELLKVRPLWAVFGYVFCTYGAFTYFLFRFPLMLAENDFSVTNIGLALSLLWVTFSLVSSLLRNLVDGPALPKILLTAPPLIAAGFVVISLSQGAVWLLLASSLVGAGLASCNSPSTQLILRFAPAQHEAIAASLDITFARIGGVLTVALLASMPFTFATISMVALCCIALICAQIAIGGMSEKAVC